MEDIVLAKDLEVGQEILRNGFIVKVTSVHKDSTNVSATWDRPRPGSSGTIAAAGSFDPDRVFGTLASL